MDKVALQAQDWFRQTVEECQAIKIETEDISKIELLKGKYGIGKRVLESESNFKEFGFGERTQMAELTAKGIGISASHLYACIEFANWVDGLEGFDNAILKLPKGKDTNWYEVSQFVIRGKGIPTNKEKKLLKRYTIVQILKMLDNILSEEIKDVNEVFEEKNSFLAQKLLAAFVEHLRELQVGENECI